MPDLTPEEIGSMLKSLGLPADPPDLPEIAHRVNAINEALSALAHPNLDTHGTQISFLAPGRGVRWTAKNLSTHLSPSCPS